MAVLNVPDAVASGTNPTEAQFDSMRSYLLNFFNGGQLDENNIATGGVTYATLGPPTDNNAIKFASSNGTMKYDSAGDKFQIENTKGDIIFGVAGSTTYGVRWGDDGALYIQGELSVNTGTSDQSVTTSWLLSRYRKPKLVYSSADIVAIEENSVISSESLVMMRDRLCEVYDRTCSLAQNANGYKSGHTGTAVSGLADGLTRTENRYYYIYSVIVQYGSQNGGTYAILVAHTTSPETSNISALNTEFGADKWLYMGSVRNGYNDAETQDNIIIPFVYDENGYCRYTEASDTGEGPGITLNESRTTANLEYTLTFEDTADASIPGTASRAVFHGYREAKGTEFHYRSTLTGENNMMVTGCYHVSSISTLHACIQMEVPVVNGYKLVVTNGNVMTDCRITLAGFQDQFV